jgi:hypothetical protein
MAKPTPWSESDKKKAIAAVKKATSYDDAILRAAAVCPGREITLNALDKMLRRAGEENLTAFILANQNKLGSDARAAELARFAAIAKKGMKLEELCDELNIAPKKAKATLAECKAAGYRIELAHGEVGYAPPTPNRDVKKVVAQSGEENIFAVASDIHVGSKWCLEDYFVDFVTQAYKAGARTILGPGDILDGVYHHSRWEENYHGFHQQSARAAKIFPRLPGLRYAMIAGNHDETFEQHNGMDVCRGLEDAFKREGRNDFQMLGARGAYVRFAPKGGRGALIELWHPRAGAAYAVSYQLQKHVEKYAVGQKPDFLFGGHTHQQVYTVVRGVHAFWSGTFHGGGGSYSKSIGGAQAIGGWIVRFAQTKEGTVRAVRPEWLGYYETEEVRELGLG